MLLSQKLIIHLVALLKTKRTHHSPNFKASIFLQRQDRNHVSDDSLPQRPAHVDVSAKVTINAHRAIQDLTDQSSGQRSQAVHR